MKNISIRSIYSIVQDNSRTIVLRDDSCQLQNMAYKSLTNDIERVVEELYETEQLNPNKKFLYYDSDGELTEVIHDSNRFKHFRFPKPEDRFLIENGLHEN